MCEAEGIVSQIPVVCCTISVAGPLRVPLSHHILVVLPGTCCGRAVLL